MDLNVSMFPVTDTGYGAVLPATAGAGAAFAADCFAACGSAGTVSSTVFDAPQPILSDRRPQQRCPTPSAPLMNERAAPLIAS